ncbi:jg2512, partial [Pararge aegeria aegeria]
GNDNQHLPVEDPRQLEQVIYHLVTDLPSPQLDENNLKNRDDTRTELAIIPPEKDQIKKAIQKSYTVIKHLRNLTDNMSSDAEPPNSEHKSRFENQQYGPNQQNSFILPQNDSVIRQNRSTVIQQSLPIIEIDDDWDIAGPSTSQANTVIQGPNVNQPSW